MLSLCVSALLFEAGIILGASSESVCYRSMRVIEEDWPYLQLERTVRQCIIIVIATTKCFNISKHNKSNGYRHSYTVSAQSCCRSYF